MRERMFTMRLNEEEATRLDKLATHYGLNAAGVIRMLLKREEDGLAHLAHRHERTMFQGEVDRVTEAAARSGVVGEPLVDYAAMRFTLLHGQRRIGPLNSQEALQKIASLPGSLFTGFDGLGLPLPPSAMTRVKRR
jgi:hypothetical protein